MPDPVLVDSPRLGARACVERRDNLSTSLASLARPTGSELPSIRLELQYAGTSVANRTDDCAGGMGRFGQPSEGTLRTKGVFELLDRHVSGGEIKDIKQSLPAELRELWPHEH